LNLQLDEKIGRICSMKEFGYEKWKVSYWKWNQTCSGN